MNVREWALPLYTILMQLGVGALGALWVLRAVLLRRYGADALENSLRNPVAIILLTLAAAMVGSFFHLSRPFLSFLSIGNFWSSWLSREIVFTVLLFSCVGLLWLLQAHVDQHATLKSVVGWAALGFGAAALYCMTHLYRLPTQASWNTNFTSLSFYGATIALGCATALTMLAFDLHYARLTHPEMTDQREAIIRDSLMAMVVVEAVMTGVTFWTYEQLMNNLAAGDPTAQASWQLYVGLYWPLLVMRLALPVVGVFWLGVAVFKNLRLRDSILSLTSNAYMATLFILIGEILGRFLFYATHIRLGI